MCVYILYTYINKIIFLFTHMLTTTYYYSMSYFHLIISLENHSMLVHKKLPCIVVSGYVLFGSYGRSQFLLTRRLLMDTQVVANLLFSLTMINVAFCLFFIFKFISCFSQGLDIGTKNGELFILTHLGSLCVDFWVHVHTANLPSSSLFPQGAHLK